MKKITYFAILLATVAGLTLGYWTMKGTPSNCLEEYLVENAKKDIEIISQEPHKVSDPEALDRVRNYLVGRLISMGLTTEVLSYGTIQDPIINRPIELNNILAVTPGNYDSYLLLVAHYDSSPKKRFGEDDRSHGAADDGYGISTILELARLIMDNKMPLVNGVKILFTDAEETGLHGAAASANDLRVTDKVSCIFNLEARGVRGPVVMFETSENNQKLIELYKKAENPFTYSVATAVYRIMPNSTDFTKFVKSGIPGLNFANLETLAYYHTVNDNYANINLNTMRHYGNQLYPIIKEFINSKNYSDVNWAKSDCDIVAFTLLPNLLVTYHPTIGYILLIIFILLTAKQIYILYRRKTATPVLIWAIKWLGLMLASATVGLAVSFFMSLLTGVPFNITYMPRIPFGDEITLLVGVGNAIALGILISRAVRNGQSELMLVGGTLIQLLFTAVLTFLLPGGAFIYLFPGLLFSMSCLSFQTTGNRLITLSISVIALLITFLMFVPVLMLLYYSLTIGALTILLLIETTTLIAVLPVVSGLLCQPKK